MYWNADNSTYFLIKLSLVKCHLNWAGFLKVIFKNIETVNRALYKSAHIFEQLKNQQMIDCNQVIVLIATIKL